MTVHRRMLAASAILLAGGPALAQTNTDQATLAAAVDRLTKAMVARDKPVLEALSAPRLSYGHSAGRIETRQEFIDNLMTGPSQFRFINLSEQTIEVVGTDAIVRHLMVGETQNREGAVTPIRIGVLQVWKKDGADWKLFARQAYRL